MIVTGISIKGLPQAMKAFTGRILRNVTADLRVIQLEQIANAFKNSGQPSAKWKPLWADKFKGKVSETHTYAIETATEGLIKARADFAKAQKELKENKAVAAFKRMKTHEKRLAKHTALAVAAESYRKGGQPLRDNGFLAASFFTKYAFVFEAEGAALIVAASNAIYAGWQQTGFKTKGPNFIPLTLQARRRHVLHANPFLEGLEEGVDYIMAWRGVDVPARPIIDYSDPVNKKEIGDVIRRSIMKKG